MINLKPFQRALHPRAVHALLLAVAMVAACAAPVAPSAAIPPEGDTVSIRASGSGSALPLVGMLADAFAETHAGVSFDFQEGTNSGGAISGVLAGTLDLAVTNRPLSVDESSQPITYQAFARDAVVFAVHRPRDLLDLSTEQVRAVYAGTLTAWQDLGAGAGPVIVLDRDENESMRKLVLLDIMGDRTVEARSVVLSSSGEMIDALNTTPGALGYTSLALLRVLRPKDVATLGFNGVDAGPDTVASGTYPWSMTFGLAHREDAPASVSEFVEWVHSAAGRRVIESYEAIPLAE